MPQSVVVNGEEFFLGVIPQDSTPDLPMVRYDELPQSKWVSFTWRPWVKKIRNQARTNGCVGHAAVGGMETSRSIAGLKHVDLSGAFCYSQINNGRDQGAQVSASQKVLRDKGACPESMGPTNKIYANQYSQNERAEAQNYRILSSEYAPSVNMFCTGLQLGYIGVFGMALPPGFQETGKSGIVQARRGNIGLHAMYAIGMELINNVWYTEVVNSWTTNFGDNGFCKIPITLFREYFDAYMIQSPMINPDHNPLPKYIT